MGLSKLRSTYTNEHLEENKSEKYLFSTFLDFERKFFRFFSNFFGWCCQNSFLHRQRNILRKNRFSGKKNLKIQEEFEEMFFLQKNTFIQNNFRTFSEVYQPSGKLLRQGCLKYSLWVDRNILKEVFMKEIFSRFFG